MNMIWKTRMGRKTLAVLAAATAAVAGAGVARAQVAPLATPYVIPVSQDLQQIVAPVALYPDALLAQALVASTYPQQVIAAAQWLRDGGNPALVDGQGWDPSVSGLVNDPGALNLLAGNYAWMSQLGSAFLNQQDDVMNAVQSVRRTALDNGTLASNAYQTVLVDDQTIQIIPANPQVIYVPVYQPQVIFEPRPAYFESSFIRFGPAVQVGVWLHDDLDWHDRAVYVGDWGAQRPWWEHHEGGGRDVNVYVDNRPGRYVDERHVTNVTNVRDVTRIHEIDRTATRWERDARSPQPQPERRPEARPVEARHSSVDTRVERARPTAAPRERSAGAAPASEQVRRAVPQAGTPKIRQEQRGATARAPEPVRRAAPAPIARPGERAAQPRESSRRAAQPAREQAAEPRQHAAAAQARAEPARNTAGRPAAQPARTASAGRSGPAVASADRSSAHPADRGGRSHG